MEAEIPRCSWDNSELFSIELLWFDGKYRNALMCSNCGRVFDLNLKHLGSTTTDWEIERIRKIGKAKLTIERGAQFVRPLEEKELFELVKTLEKKIEDLETALEATEILGIEQLEEKQLTEKQRLKRLIYEAEKSVLRGIFHDDISIKPDREGGFWIEAYGDVTLEELNEIKSLFGKDPIAHSDGSLHIKSKIPRIPSFSLLDIWLKKWIPYEVKKEL